MFNTPEANLEWRYEINFSPNFHNISHGHLKKYEKKGKF